MIVLIIVSLVLNIICMVGLINLSRALNTTIDSMDTLNEKIDMLKDKIINN